MLRENDSVTNPMMNSFQRIKSRLSSRPHGRRTSSRKFRNERLEARTMLAGDVANIYHNADMPADVSGDGTVTLNDALLLVGELRDTGPRSLLAGRLGSAGEGEGNGNGGLFLDVNGDTMLSLGDPLGVISDLRSEGEGLAVNDNFDVMENSSNNLLTVLDNDQSDPGDALSINEISLNVNGTLVEEANTDAVILSATGSSFSISADRQSIQYTPLPGFFGEERVTYELNDGNGGLTLATATIEVSPVNAAIRYRLETTTVGGVPTTNIDQGDDFILRVFVQDIRSDLGDPSIQGNEQGFLDVTFDTNFVSFVGTDVNDLTFGSDFTEFQDATISAGEIGEAGGARDFSANPPPPPLGNGERLLFAAQFTADNAGMATFSGNHPEDFFSQTLVTNPFGGENIFTPGVTPAEDFFVLEFVDTTLTINPAGFAMSDSRTINEDSGTTQIDVLANDTGATLAINMVSDPPNGTAMINDNGTPGDTSDDVIDYTPDANFAGVDSFTYTAFDGTSTDTATVTVTVNDVNDNPTAVNDTFNVTFDSGQQTLDVLANDSTAPDDPSLETLTVASVSTTTNGGTVSVSGTNDSVLYTPPPGQFSTDTFTYTISDGRSGVDTATVTILGTAFDDVVRFRLEPSATTVDEGDTITVDVFVQDLRNDPSIDLGVAQAFINFQYDAAIFAPVAGGDGTIVDFTGEYEAIAPGPTFTMGEIQNVGGFHPDGFSANGIPNGGDEFFFFSVDFLAIGDGTADFTTSETGNQILFPIQLTDPTGTNDPVDPADVDFGTTQVTVTPPVFDTDVVVTVQAVDAVSGVPITMASVGEIFEIQVSVRDTRVTTPTADFPAVAAAYIDLLIADLGSAVSVVANSFESGPNYGTFPLEGTPINGVGIDDIGDAIDFGVINDVTFDGNQNQLVFSLDFMADGLGEVTFQSATSNNTDNTIEFLDPTGPVPLSEITFGSATVFIADANAPTAVSDQYATFQDTALSVPAATGVLANDSDPTNDPLTAVLQSDVSNGTLTLNTDGSFSYIPDTGFVGTDVFTYRAVDSNNLQSNTAIVRISVGAASGLLANDDVFTTDVDTPLNLSASNLLLNDLGIGLTVTDVVTQPFNGTLVATPMTNPTTFNYTPNAGFTGIDFFTYQVTDGTGAVDTARVAIGVGVVPGSIGGRVYFDSDIDGTYEPAHGELAIGNGEVTIIGSDASLGEFYRRTFTTDSNGLYGLGTALPGTYSIVESFPEFTLSGTHTTNGVVTTDIRAGIDTFTATDVLTDGEDTVVNFGHMGMHPDFASIRDRFGSTPESGMIIAQDTAGENLWYAKIGGWDSIFDPSIDVATDGLTAALTVQNGSTQEFTLPLIGTPNFRELGTREGEGSIFRVEGSMADALANGEGELDTDALDALFAEGN